MVANHWSNELADVADKVYARDLFKRDKGRGFPELAGFTLQSIDLS